ncbi:hypothetical protein COLO4_15804 [Corchorus olitorius]|uniref:Uncharacterized protein n=1 Tax=Corchorus olitorius TaxID=93759 RepID=A0A1R3JL57_9ROSI|nr:hypothetical protein COLO4_15804 [Corchorus olitorius]
MRVLSIALAALLLLFLLQIQTLNASRLLHEESKLVKKLDLQSLQKGPVPPSEGSSCTNVPGNGGPGCPLNEMHYAGGAALPRAGTFPSLTVQFGVATGQK